MSGLPPPPVADPEGIHRLRAALRSVAFDAGGVGEALGIEGPNLTPSPAQVPVLLRSLGDGDPLATLIRLFVVTVPVAAEAAAAALAPLPLDRAVAMNLVTLADEGRSIRSLLRLVPAGPVLVASDLTPDLSRLPRDVVMGVSPTSWTLANLTFRRPVETALDVGTGCGIQAMLSARHAARVTATDVSGRALAFTRFSAALNGLDNVELVEGDLFDPVAGRRFDLVVGNPPFVVSPDDEFAYRDGGRVGDELSRAVVEGAAAALAPGGFAQVLVSWVHGGEDDDWSQPLRRWTDGSGCDAWLFRFESQDPESYTVAWNRPLETDPDRHAAAVERWLDYFSARGIEAIGYGAVALRRRPAASGPPWVRARSVGGIPTSSAGEQVWGLFAAASFLERVGGAEGLTGQRFVVDGGLRIEQVLRLRDGSLEVEEALLRLEAGLVMVAEIDQYTAELLAALQQGATLAEAFGAAAGLLGDDLDREGLWRATLELVEGLLELGLLHPASRI
jgi:methylase of polypeptide subunit release factors